MACLPSYPFLPPPELVVLLGTVRARRRNMWNDLQSWWQNFTPETQTLVWDGGLAALALVGGWIAGAVVARILDRWNFDGAFRLSSVPGGYEDRGLTPTRVAALLVRLTIWAAAAGWLAGRY